MSRNSSAVLKASPRTYAWPKPNIPFESHLLDLQKFEQHKPEHLALNPNGVVPTLVDQGKPVFADAFHR